MKKHMLLDIMKCINKFANLKNTGMTDISQLLTIYFSLDIKDSKD